VGTILLSTWPAANDFAGERPRLKSNVAPREAFMECVKALRLDPSPTLHDDLPFEGGVTAGRSIFVGLKGWE
jgi:hypothetical protein